MPRLDDDLDSLKVLDELRDSARALMRLGRDSVRGVENIRSHPEWDKSDDIIESALLLRVQNKTNPGSGVRKLVARITALSLAEDLLPPRPDTIPVLLAARALQALVGTAAHAFSPAAILCYYRIVRELYVADSPDWSAGGARAGMGGEATAFITGECVRAILTFVRTLRQTAAFFRNTGDLHLRLSRLRGSEVIQAWRDVEIERLGLGWYVSTEPRVVEIALDLDRTEPAGRIDLSYVEKYLERLSREVLGKIDAAGQNFQKAFDQIEECRRSEQDPDARRPGTVSRMIRSESAHQIALGVVQDATRKAAAARALCQTPAETLDNLGRIGELFEDIANQVRKILDPATRFVATILDRELTAAAAVAKPVWDARELVFAASAFGAATDWREDERLVRACNLLASSISERGDLPVGRPFHSTPSGLRLHPVQFEVYRAFAELLQNVDVPVDPRLVRRMIHPFHEFQLAVEWADGTKGVGWHFEHPPIPRKPTLWATAVAILALEKIARMIDSKINGVVLAHFSVLMPVNRHGALGLGDLLYPDHGRHLLPRAPGSEDSVDVRGSVAIVLEAMRAHIRGVPLPPPYRSPAFSIILHGPPGTGKTTLLEALARSSGVPLVALSPSDIAVAGEELIESRTRAVFQALAMLTSVVIILDEFEPVMLSRDAQGQQRPEMNIFTFLTPGMLPKLAALHQAAEERAMVYCLVTNRYDDLDRAATRPGRFDRHIGIYHPDPLSRAGVLEFALRQSVGPLLPAQRARFEEVIRRSSGVSAVRLARGWFRPPAVVDPRRRAAWTYVVEGGKWDPPEVELPDPAGIARDEEKLLVEWERVLQDPDNEFTAVVSTPRDFVAPGAARRSRKKPPAAVPPSVPASP